jgi:hypothetical protein
MLFPLTNVKISLKILIVKKNKKQKNKLTSHSWIYIPKDDHLQEVIIQSGSTELCSRVLTSAKVKVIISGREWVSVELDCSVINLYCEAKTIYFSFSYHPYSMLFLCVLLSLCLKSVSDIADMGYF